MLSNKSLEEIKDMVEGEGSEDAITLKGNLSSSEEIFEVLSNIDLEGKDNV